MSEHTCPYAKVLVQGCRSDAVRLQNLDHVAAVNIENAVDEQNVHVVVESMSIGSHNIRALSSNITPLGYNGPAKAGLQLFHGGI